MTALHPYPCYNKVGNKVCYKGTVLYSVLRNADSDPERKYFAE